MAQCGAEKSSGLSLKFNPKKDIGIQKNKKTPF
jgi:hypothetical protein